ncbi:hypothetical protein Bhyg_01724 [Pseudolycoriella hygida]|uniref:Uncharacterized protein n=1 Tax=Pseudolycoriella hygida TaxID=35572 RepID=A0A9Q0NAS8_9DIPT|nr:hypothetical protein Bhyg_01724 [Pseudolycoriella hygida]
MSDGGNDRESSQQHTAIDIAVLKLYVKYLEAKEVDERKSKIQVDEKFLNVKCYRNIFGTATSFRLIVGFSWFKKNFNGTIAPLNGTRSPVLFIRRCTEPGTFRMSANDKNNPEFVTYINRQDTVTAFSPDVPEPICAIVRRKAKEIINDESDIHCYATNTKFALKNFESDYESSNVPSMKTFDSEGNVVAAADVRKMRTVTNNYGTTRELLEFAFHIDENISEPTKVMLLVAFSNWAMWSKNEANGRNLCHTLGCLLIIALVIAFFMFLFGLK